MTKIKRSVLIHVFVMRCTCFYSNHCLWINQDNHQWMECGKIHTVTFPFRGPALPITTRVIMCLGHDDVIKWTHFPSYWPFVREITCHLWIPLTKASDAELWFFICALNKQLKKQTWYGWFETLSRPIWRHCNGANMPQEGSFVVADTAEFDSIIVHILSSSIYGMDRK